MQIYKHFTTLQNKLPIFFKPYPYADTPLLEIPSVPLIIIESRACALAKHPA